MDREKWGWREWVESGGERGEGGIGDEKGHRREQELETEEGSSKKDRLHEFDSFCTPE